MSRSAHNEEVLERVRRSVSEFVAGELDLDGIQVALQSAMPLLERDGTGADAVVRAAEADIEEIRFTRLLDEQRPAAVFRLDRFLELLDAADP